MNTITKSLLALALGAATLTSPGQDAPRPHRGGGPGPAGPEGGRPRVASPIVTALDADKNHEISAEEIAGAPKALLALDKNGDGKLTADELRAPRPEGDGRRPGGDDAPPPQAQDGARPRPHPPLVAALDSDHDGEISAAEINHAGDALKTLDKNGDGKLTPEEFAGRRQGGGRGPGGPGGPGGPHGGKPGQPPKDA
jgi:hypothetical protein